MKPEELKRELSQGLSRQVYLLYGDEPYLIQQYCKQFTKLIVPDETFRDFNLYRTDKIDAERIEQFLQTPPVFSEKKLLLLKDTDVFKKPKATDKEFLLKILSDVPDYSYIVFAEQTVDKKQKKLLELTEEVECNQMTEDQLKAWINILVQRQNKKITVKTIEYLISRCGTGMFHLEQEINKLCSCATEDVITTGVIDQLTTRSAENRIYSLSNAILEKQNKLAFSILADLKVVLDENTGKPLEIRRIINTISQNFCLLYKIKKCPNPTATALGLSPYRLKNNLSLVRKISEERLSTLISLVSDCDYALKSSTIKEWTLLEVCIAACLEA